MIRGNKRACPFCRADAGSVFYEDELVLGLWDAFPVSPGHALLITRRHASTWFDATEEEQAALLKAIGKVKEAVERRYRPDGWNIGVNVGAAGGQSVFHLHVHVIPRYAGDAGKPRGGIRQVLAAKADYPQAGEEAGDAGGSGEGMR